MNNYEFLVLFYCIQEDDPSVFGPLGELTRCAYPNYNKPADDNCLGHIESDSPLSELKEYIECGFVDVKDSALELLGENPALLEAFVSRVVDLAIL